MWGATIDSISQSQDGVYESVTLSTATKSNICTDFQLLESFSGTADVNGRHPSVISRLERADLRHNAAIF